MIRISGVESMMYCIESWVPQLNKWCSVELMFNKWRARDAAEILADVYRRPYRVTDENRVEFARFTGER